MALMMENNQSDQVHLKHQVHLANQLHFIRPSIILAMCMAGLAMMLGAATSPSALAQDVTADPDDTPNRFADLIYGATLQQADTSSLNEVPAGDADQVLPSPASQADDFSMIEAGRIGIGEANDALGMQIHDFPRIGFSSADSEAMGNWLTLSDVIASLYRSYPEIASARQQLSLANGQVTQSLGAFDTVLKATSLAEPTGFYENYRQQLSIARRTWWGGYIGAGYKLGRGSFQPWYEERDSEEAGEFSVNASAQLLRGREIDPQRVAVFRASLERRAATPIFQKAILESSHQASHLYWMWTAAGAAVQAQRQLLQLAEMRGRQYEVGVKAGKFPEVDQILNNQLIAERRAKLIETQQKFQATGFKLSVFLRGQDGNPLVPQAAWLPRSFPVLQSPEIPLEVAISMAIARRPEPRLLQIKLQQLSYDRALARNDTLPTLHTFADLSQDVGEPASSSDDKGQLELLLGFEGELPVQRRTALGKLRATNAKIRQVDFDLRLTRDKITAEVQEALNRLRLNKDISQQAMVALRAAVETLSRYEFGFRNGTFNLIDVNQVEQKANETQIKLVESWQNWFIALSDLQFSLGIDPLDQALEVSTLPLSEMIDVSAGSEDPANRNNADDQESRDAGDGGP